MSGRLKILDVMSVTSYSNMTKVFLERVKNQFLFILILDHDTRYFFTVTHTLVIS
jgi:hypothetical protein